MASQSNILITQLIEDPNFYDNDDIDFDDENVEVPMIDNGQIVMRFGHDGGPSMINYMLNLPFYHLKALCYHGHTNNLKKFIERIDLFKERPNQYPDFFKQFGIEVSCEGRIFGMGVEYVSQLFSLGFGTQVFSLASHGEDLWGEDEEPCHIVNCYGEGRNLVINFKIAEDNDYSIANDPEFYEELRKNIDLYNETIITPEYKQYYIKSLDRGFSVHYNMVLALQILRYKEEILKECENKSILQLYNGFMLKEIESEFTEKLYE